MTDTLDALFNDRKVHVRLATRLFDRPVSLCHVDRYSLVEADGIATQQAVTSARFAGKEPEVDAYRLLTPGDVALWDPSDPKRLDAEARAAAEAFGLHESGIVWVRGRDVHPNCRHNQVVACLVLLGTKIFVRATASAVKRAIRRPDGADENAYSVLICQLMRYYGGHGSAGLKIVRWDEDVTRGVRDDLSGAAAVDAAVDWGVALQFGDGRIYDPQDENDRQILNMLLNQGSNDDVRRRKRLMGKSIAKLLNGGWGLSEKQLPPGYRLQRDEDGKPLHVPGKGKVPEPDQGAIDVVRRLWTLHASNTSYVDLGRHMARLGVPRRGQKKSASFEGLVEDENWAALSEAAASFFINAAADPHRDIETYLQKVHLLRTGNYRVRINNEIRGRGRVVNGIAAVPWDDTDEYGYFPVEVHWGWPVHPATGEVFERFGLTPAQIDASEARLRKELCPERRLAVVGGQAHRRPVKRALRPTDWSDDDHEYGVKSRTTNAGRFTDVVLQATKRDRDGRRKNGSKGGWNYELHQPKEYVIGTYALSDLCGSVSNDLRQQVERLLKGGDQLAELESPDDRSVEAESQRRARALTSRLELLESQRQQKLAEADDIDLLVARALRNADPVAVERNERRADGLRKEADSLTTDIAGVESEIAACLAGLSHDETGKHIVEANVTVAGYLVDGLRRCAANNGLGSERLAQVAREHLTDWWMDVSKNGIQWRCSARIPLVDGTTAILKLSGLIDNVRLAQGGRHETSPDVLAKQLFFEGRTLEDVLSASHIASSRNAHLDRRLMPWLRDNGVTSRAAKCALVDHPVSGVQQLVYGHLTELPTPASSWPAPLRRAILDYYTNPNAEGGFAACLDDMVPIQRILTTLLQEDLSGQGIEVEALAVALSQTTQYVWGLANPPARSGGARRPRFVEQHPESRDRIRLFRCSYCRRRDAVAAQALYLGEVATSGYGVICECGRPPVPRDHPEHGKWRRIAFHSDFTDDGLITRVSHTALNEGPQTAFVPMPSPLVLPRRHRGRRAA